MIIDQFKKIGGHPFACSTSDPFRLFMNNNGMVDFGFFGNPFTWSNMVFISLKKDWIEV
jgi:hypothetical protein